MGLGFKKKKDPMEEIFNMKFAINQLNRDAKKADKDEKKERQQVRKALERHDESSARVYSASSIRKKKQAFQLRQMAASLGAVVSTLERQATMGNLTSNIASMSRTLDKALSSDRVDDVSQVINKFMTQVEDLEVQSAYLEETMTGSSATTADVGQVDGLVAQIAAEHQLEFQSNMALPPQAVQGQANTADMKDLGTQ